MTEFPLEELLPLLGVLLVSGAAAGIIAGLLGVGGGVVIVPALLYAFELLHYDPTVTTHLAVGTSLATIVPTAISATRAHHKRGSVDWELLKRLAPAVMVGSILGALVAGGVGGNVLKGVFGVIALLMAANLFRTRELVLGEQLPSVPVTSSSMGLIGFLSAMMGIGGGTLFVPFLNAFSVPIQRAVGTSSSLGIMIALPGALGFMWVGGEVSGLPPLSLGYVSGVGLACMVPMTVLFAPQGAKLAHRLEKKTLKRFFALFLVVMALRMFWKMFSA